jgi:glycosyltransferase involved in cell wall biosynthesis
MKILLSNKFYYRRGGDCIYMLNLEHLLKSKKHEVAIFAMQYPENIQTKWNKYFPSEVKFALDLGMMEAFMRPFGTSEVKNNFTALLDDFCPDIVHLNNIHSQISPLIAEIAHQRGIKVIWTLHDYKLLCPRYDCLRNGEVLCEACFSDKHKVLEYKCMKNSKLASILSYWEAKMWSKKRLEQYTDIFICPSKFIADKMIQGGFDAKKLKVLCNFIDIGKMKRDEYIKKDYYCYVGRLSHEKGVKTLIEAAKKTDHHLIIIGEGPLMQELKADATDNVEFTGFQKWPNIKEIVGKAKFTVIPSEWYENNPLSVIEAQCLGTPVLGAQIGGIPELIDKESGMTFESRNIDDLKNKIEIMWKSTFNYKKLAEDSQTKYSAENYYQKLLAIYQ